ncbi:MAG: ATP-binding cassette domain-containing protein [Propionibacteriaceae bacterium]|jgi:NitT/TauT family transport system ATP-binding protein|nr:ATP-binding cassette domain-containing protein [Propionibacteriaceae bacterium]
MISFTGVSFSYGDRVVLRDLSARADRLLVTGPNGSGKTTLLRLLLGSLQPSRGRVERGGWARRAAVFQDDRLVEHLSALANLRLACPGAIANRRLEAELTAVGLTADSWGRSVNGLSGGQRRRVALARALLPEADLICLDEPFNGIDAASRAALRAYVGQRSQGHDLVLTTHDEADLAAFDGLRLELPGPG